jgi:hypothetical protein
MKLGESIALSKYHGLQATVKPKRKTLREMLHFPNSELHHVSGTESQFDTGTKEIDFSGLATASLYRSPGGSSTSVAREAMADGDIPLFFRRYTEKYPFGNVHMALRVGPLVIENGVSQ